MNDQKGILSSGLGRVMRNKRYIFWFWLLNLTLAYFATSGFRRAAHAILDHRFYSERLTHGFDLGVFIAMLMRPEFPPTDSLSVPALCFGFLFFLATALFLPGVFLGYSSTYRLPREEFFRACGRNLWRYIRIMVVAGIVMGIIAGLLFAANIAIVKKAGESTSELLPVKLQFIGMGVIFLVMTTLRIWFDLAEADAVLNDQRAVRKSIAAGFRHTFRSLGRLLGSYVIAALVAIIILLGGIWIWLKAVSPEGVIGAFALSQITLLLLLIPRFWQRGIAVSYWQQKMLVPVVAMKPVEPLPPAPPLNPEPVPVTRAPVA
ncbi:MAG TPA: hypothetical protein VM715_23175 [Candidatus Acidoferrum sp.]|jgi:hypothetical protein|nr:hypothetical protein [Candidatus Acidoferrum sp.]